MAAGWNPQLSFGRGEYSPLLHARYDLDHYKIALKKALNFQILRTGGATRRSGTLMVAAIKAQNDDFRLLEHIRDETTAYCIEMGYQGAGYFRFFRNGAAIESGGDPYEKAHPYTQEQIARLDYAVSFDTIFIADESVAPQTLLRQAETDWIIKPYEFTDGPYETLNLTATTLKPNAASGNVTIVASSVNGINGGVGFKAADMGRWVRILAGAAWGAGKIINVVSPTSVILLVEATRRFMSLTAVTTWRLGSWTNSTDLNGKVLGFPRRVGFLGERMVWASSPGHPSTAWMSENGILHSFSVGPVPKGATGTETTPIADTDALQFDISGVSNILWLAEQDDLLYATAQNARAIGPTDRGAALSQTNVAHRKGRTGGFAAVRPAAIGTSLLAVSRFQKSIRDVSYNFDKETYQAPDVSVLSEHLFHSNVQQVAACIEPDQTAFFRRADGKVICGTYEPEQSMVAFTPFEFAPSRADNGEWANVLQIAAVPGEQVYHLWLATKRVINGETVRLLEMQQPRFDHDGSVVTAADGWFVDCGLSFEDAAGATEWGGFDHLIGETAAIMTDRGVHPPVVVDEDGFITLNYSVTKIIAGLGFPAQLQTLPFPAGQDGSLLGRKRKPARVVVDFYKSGPVDVSQDGGRAERYIKRKPEDPTDAPIPLFTGAVNRPIEASWEKEGSVLVAIGANEPGPVCIRAVIPGTDSEP